MQKTSISSLMICVCLSFSYLSCDEEIIETADCFDTSQFASMGFSTWPFAQELIAKDWVYDFIEANTHIYSEQIDQHIPWQAWVNNSTLPTAFTDDIADRKSRIVDHKQLVVSASILNSDRNNLLDDYDGFLPEVDSISDPIIVKAYSQHLKYLVDELNPDYLIISMEFNELFLNNRNMWNHYFELISEVKTLLKADHPDLPISESISLHRWFGEENNLRFYEVYDEILKNHIEEMDFAAISFYPFLNRLDSVTEYQKAFDFLHDRVTKPILISETGQLAENLVLNSSGITIDASFETQDAYLKTLIEVANEENYMGYIWWTISDYDLLWQTFPDESKELGKIWRDTGIINESGILRPSHDTWIEEFERTEGLGLIPCM